MEEFDRTMSAGEMCQWLAFLNIESDSEKDGSLDARARAMQGL